MYNPDQNNAVSTDEEMVYQECQRALTGQREVNDGCARTIASWYYADAEGYAFVSTGTISNPTTLWRGLAGDVYESETPANKLALDFLGTYLINAGKRGPQPGWSDRWVR